MASSKKVIVAGVSIWPQPKTNPRSRYRISYGPKHDRKTIIASTDLETTVDLAREISKRGERIRLGLAKPAEERFAEQDRRPIVEHLDDWRDAMIHSGCTPKHVRQFHRYASAIILGSPAEPEKKARGRKSLNLDGIGADRISEIVPSLIQREVAKVNQSRGAATANRHLDAVRAFLAWGVGDLRWEKNVIEHIDHYNIEADRKRIRRVVSVDDMRRLVAAADAGPAAEGVVGAERGLLYRTCLASGLRANEARHMTVADLVLTSSTPGVWTTAKRAKNRRRIFLAFPPALVESLATWVKGMEPTDRVFNVPENTSRMIRADLAACDPPIPYKTADGVFDFHAMRHLCGAILVSAGVSIKAVQSHLRHSTIKLTLDTYGHMLDEDKRKIVASLPDFRSLRPAQRTEGSYVRPSSLEFAEMRKKTHPKGSKPRLEHWSHGESNPDLLNAIQLLDLRKSNIHRKIYRTVGESIAPGAARRANRRIRTALSAMFRAKRRTRKIGGAR